MMPVLADNTKFLEEIRLFAKSRGSIPRSLWFNGQNMKVYLRDCPRIIAGQRYEVITISNVLVFNPGQGVYRDFLGFMDTLGEHLFIENVFDVEQHPIYLTRGYTAIQLSDYDPALSFYKLLAETSK
jgi:hypothetical protein